MSEISMAAFFDELAKIAETQQREPTSAWAPKTIGAPRAKMPDSQLQKAPATPGSLAPKVKMPASHIGKRLNYSQPYTEEPQATNPDQGLQERQAPPPNVVFGVR